MIDTGETAFVGGCGLFEIANLGKYKGQWSAAEGVGRFFDADTWQGQKHGKQELDNLCKYDTVIVNFNSCHLPIPIALEKEKINHL